MTTLLAKQGYVVVPGLLDHRLSRIIYDVLLLREWRGESKRDDQVPEAASYWGDSTLDAVLIGVLPDIEAVVGSTLLPTYSYARLYHHGQSLARHRDRAACEIAATIHLGYAGSPPPPIEFAPNVAVTQSPGDAVVYLGDEVDHWRRPFEGTNFGQLFLNYVRADGDRQSYVFDGRRDAFPPALSHEVDDRLDGRR